MKTLKNYALPASFTLIATILLSWSISTSSDQKFNSSLSSYLYEKNVHGFTGADLTAFAADDDWNFSPGKVKYPPAEDVLIQKIPGDKSHLLLIAFYSKENYSGPFVTVNNNGNQLVFRDDGQGYD